MSDFYDWCAACGQEMVYDPDDPPHTYHEPGCPVITADPDDIEATDLATASCECPQTAECHPGCCPICQEQGVLP